MTDKCKLMTLQNQNISLDIEPIKNVFVFLGSLIPVSASELSAKSLSASVILRNQLAQNHTSK